MSPPGYCWRCGTNPTAEWFCFDDRVWCPKCLSVALSLAAVIMNFPDGIAACLAGNASEGVANEVERILAAAPVGEILPPWRRW